MVLGYWLNNYINLWLFCWYWVYGITQRAFSWEKSAGWIKIAFLFNTFHHTDVAWCKNDTCNLENGLLSDINRNVYVQKNWIWLRYEVNIVEVEYTIFSCVSWGKSKVWFRAQLGKQKETPDCRWSNFRKFYL